MRKNLLLVVLLLLSCVAGAQTAPEWDAAKIKLQLEKLNTMGTVLYLAAHPDDENTRLLGYLSNGAKYRTGYLSLTRGDGGQNLIGDEQGELLGLVRTQELLAARRIDGAEQFFSRANDFGFSKSAEETFKFWGKERILADAVWVIRKFRPDVIICRFPEDRRAGHGHHWASAIIAHEAFKAAADPKMFPEQLKYVQPWQAKRLLWNTFNFGGENTTASDQFKMDVGGFNPLLGESYGEIAAESRSMHKSQGFGVSRQRGESFEYFKTIAGDAPANSLMDGVNTTWSRVNGGAAIGAMISKIIAEYDMDNPAKSLPALLSVYRSLQNVKDEYWKKQKTGEVVNLIQACAGLWTEVDAESATVAPGDKLGLHVQVINRSVFPITLEKIIYPDGEKTVGQSLPDDKAYNADNTIHIAENTPVSQPYWLLEDHPAGYYMIRDQQLVGRPENPPAAQVQFVFNLDGTRLTIARPVEYRYTDPVKGEIYQPLSVSPPVTANIENKVYIFSGDKAQTVQVKLKSFTDNKVEGTASVDLPAGFEAVADNIPFTLTNKGDEADINFQVRPKSAVTHSSADELRVIIRYNGKDYTKGIKVISYSHIPTITLFPPATAKLVSVNLKTDGKKIGYIMGAGDMVPDALRQVGYEVTMLDDKDIAAGNLQQYDAIITGVRVYNVNKQMKFLQPRLLDYVKNGGVLVVQYNTNRGLVTDQLGPYPFRISGDRVTDETAKVNFLAPDNEIMNYPNKITEQDFDGWIQERGIYFPSDADSHYTKLFSMHDPGESPLNGSTIVADYGSGKYVYTGLDFFRELPAGVPGAFRLFVNMIAKKQ